MLFQPLLVTEFPFAFLLCFLVFFCNFFEKMSNRLGFDRTIATKESESWLLIDFYVGNTRAILPPIVLLLHEDVQLVHGISRPIFIDVIGEGLSQTNEGNSAFVKDVVAHIFDIRNQALGKRIKDLASKYQAPMPNA